VLLIYVGIKMTIAHWYHVPTWLSLLVIMTVMTVAIIASVIHDRKH
jgi:tellurite resistance protein TerC